MGKKGSKFELLDFIQQAAVESSKTPTFEITDKIVKKLSFYQNLYKEDYFNSILKEV